MSALHESVSAADRETHLDRRLGDFRRIIGIFFSAVLDRFVDQGRNPHLPELQRHCESAIDISLRMVDLDLGVGADNLDLVKSLFHMG